MYRKIEKEDLSDWVRGSFLLPKNSITDEQARFRSMPDGLFKFGDTTIGGNQTINPLPQYSAFADINARRYHHTEAMANSFMESFDHMGRKYCEEHDDNQVILHMRMGVPAYTSSLKFFGNFYNSDAASLANRGRSNEVARFIGRVVGMVASMRIMPYILVGQALNFLFDSPSTKFYTLKPTPHIYNEARSTIFNTLMSNEGFVAGMNNYERPEGVERQQNMGESRDWNKLLPDVYNSNGSIDIYNVTTRYQRLADQRQRMLQEVIGESTTPRNALNSIMEVYKRSGYPDENNENASQTIDEYVSEYFTLDQYKAKGNDGQGQPSESQKQTEKEESGVWNTFKGWFSSDNEAEGGAQFDPATAAVSQDMNQQFMDQAPESSDSLYGVDEADPSFMDKLRAEQRDGGQFISFRIEDPGASTTTINNSVKESALASGMNSMSSKSKDLRFNLSDGQLVGGIAGDFIGAITSGLGAFIGGVAESFGVAGVGALLGNALVDIPKHWDQSIAQAPKLNCKMELRAWSGDPLTRMQSLMLPAISVLAACSPRSTGYQSYTGPFLCEYYCKGRSQSRLAIIDSFVMRHGTGNLGFTNKGKPLGIDVEFTLLDLSSVLHMPLTAGFSPVDMILPGGVSKYLFNDENSFTDLMAVLGSLGLVDQIYTTKRLRKNFHKLTLNFDTWTSGGRWASTISNSGFLFGASPGRILSAFANPIDRGS